MTTYQPNHSYGAAIMPFTSECLIKHVRETTAADASSHELKVWSGHFAYLPVDQRQMVTALARSTVKKICAMASCLLRCRTKAYCGIGLAVAAGAEA